MLNTQLSSQIDVTETMLVQVIDHCVEAIQRLTKNKRCDEFTQDALGSACLARHYLKERAAHKKQQQIRHGFVAGLNS